MIISVCSEFCFSTANGFDLAPLDLDKGTSQINVIKVQIVLESINI